MDFSDKIAESIDGSADKVLAKRLTCGPVLAKSKFADVRPSREWSMFFDAFSGLGRIGATMQLRDAIRKFENELPGEDGKKIAGQKTNTFALNLEIGTSMPNSSK